MTEQTQTPEPAPTPGILSSPIASFVEVSPGIYLNPALVFAVKVSDAGGSAALAGTGSAWMHVPDKTPAEVAARLSSDPDVNTSESLALIASDLGLPDDAMPSLVAEKSAERDRLRLKALQAKSEALRLAEKKLADSEREASRVRENAASLERALGSVQGKLAKLKEARVADTTGAFVLPADALRSAIDETLG